MRTSNLILLIALVAALGVMTNSPTAVEAVQSTVINFFLHDRLLTATNPSAFIIRPPLAGVSDPIDPSLSIFGTAAVFDDSMTVSPDENSMEIGRGRGFYLFDQNSPGSASRALEFSWTAEFNQASGYTPGSTLTFKGFDRITDPVREIAIVGGTGDFRLARGWAVITTYSLTGIGNANINITAYFQYGF
ncbi:unnamed protein product [Calypogeia fissa]